MEIFLVRMKKNSSLNVRSVIEAVNLFGGNINAVLKDGAIIICTLDNKYAETIRRQRGVGLVGGVTINKRKIVKKRRQTS